MNVSAHRHVCRLAVLVALVVASFLGPGAALAAITEKGRTAITAAIPLWEQAQRQITDGLGHGRWDAVRRDLQRLTTLAGENLSMEGPDS